MQIEYHPSGVCAKGIRFTVEDGVLTSLAFQGGCEGNLQGLTRLAEGLPVEDVVKKLAGIRCGGKKTSCPDQLAKALQKAVTDG